MSKLQQVVLIEPRQLYAELLIGKLADLVDDAKFVAYATASEVVPDVDAINLIVLVASTLSLESVAAMMVGAKTNPALADVPLAIVADNSEPSIIIKTLELGARGFVPTSFPLTQVAHALRLILAGGVFVPAQSFRALSSQPQQAVAQAQQTGLSPAQLRIAKALRRGTPNKLIAYDLNMAESTVKVHVRTIMKKLKARNRTEIAFLTNQMFEEVD